MTEAAKTELELSQEKANEAAKAVNDSRSGKGTRLRVGLTRGRNPQVITFENFDESLPETLPGDLSEFMKVTGIDTEKTIVSYLIDGYNSAQYTTASDPVAEYVDYSWPEEVQKAFRLVVRNYASNANVSIEDAVALIKPGIVASQAKK